MDVSVLFSLLFLGKTEEILQVESDLFFWSLLGKYPLAGRGEGSFL